MWCLCGEFGIGSTIHSLIDIFLYSHYLCAWYCTDRVRRNSVLVTGGTVEKRAKKLCFLTGAPVKPMRGTFPSSLFLVRVIAWKTYPRVFSKSTSCTSFCGRNHLVHSFVYTLPSINNSRIRKLQRSVTCFLEMNFSNTFYSYLNVTWFPQGLRKYWTLNLGREWNKTVIVYFN